FFVQYCYKSVYGFFIKSVSQAKIDVTVVFEWIITSDQMTRNNLIFSSNINQKDVGRREMSKNNVFIT
uniref:Ovule protein n=1 Tax=Romanomermis culicivorax TaxID=13658 RepID=A0A915HYI3_ROMCU